MAADKVTPAKKPKLDTVNSSSSASTSWASPSPSASAKAKAMDKQHSPDGARPTGKRPKKVGTACVYCRRSHMTCNAERPCQRCIKRDIGHLCHDETPTRPNHSRASGAAAFTSGRKSSASSSSSSSKQNATEQAIARQQQQQPSASPSIVTPTSNALSTSTIANVLAGSGAQGSPHPLGPIMGILQNDVHSAANGLSAQLRTPIHPDMLQANAMLSASQQQANWVASMLGGASFLGLGGGDINGLGNGFSASGDAAGGNEYNILSEFLESLDGATGLPISSSTTIAPVDANVATSNVNGQGDGAAVVSQPETGSTITFTAENTVGSQATHSLARNRRLSLVDPGYAALVGGSKTDKFFLTAADQKDGTRDERLGRVIQAKLDAGLLRPYNHVKGYARLNQWMEQNCSQTSRRRILKPLSIFRPAFRSVAAKLTNVDLIFIEEAFERLLLDYDRVFSTQGIPACLWRRTGEIYKGNKEFADLVGVDFEALRDGQCTIYEVMQEESAVNYWEKYGAVCFDPGQKAVLTSCVLKASDHKKKRVKPQPASTTASAPRSGVATPLPPTSASMSTKNSSMANSPGPNGTAAADTAKEADKQPAQPGVDSSSASDTNGEAQKPSSSEADNERNISCCFSFTIRRDAWGIPYAIIGNFLPLHR